MVKRLVLMCCLLVLFSVNSAVEANPQIRVGIVNEQRSAIFACENEYVVLDATSGATVDVFAGGSSHMVVADGGKLKIDGNAIASRQIVVQAKEEQTAVEVNKRKYRGVFQVNLQANGDSLNVVNRLSVEEYLYSTVAHNAQPLWPTEAAKSQAIVSRTIAFYMMENSFSKDYDIPANYWLFYAGTAVERDDVESIVNQTKGQVVVLDGKPIKALFHASSGGKTESVAGVSYLQSVVDYDQDSPKYEWEKLFDARDVDKALKYAGYESIGKLQGFDFSAFNKNLPNSPADRSASGRLKEVKVLGDRGFAMISGEKFSAILDLPSSAFDLAVANLLPQTIEIPITDRFGNVIGVKEIPVMLEGTGGRVFFPPNRMRVQRVAWAENEKLVFKGNGQGDGIGFSQWGARGLALEKNYEYDKILSHYYPNTTLKQLY